MDIFILCAAVISSRRRAAVSLLFLLTICVSQRWRNANVPLRNGSLAGGVGFAVSHRSVCQFHYVQLPNPRFHKVAALLPGISAV